jgi:hypothetical protein
MESGSKAATFSRPRLLEKRSSGNSERPPPGHRAQIIGSAPMLIEPCEIVAVAEGASGFIESASFG